MTPELVGLAGVILLLVVLAMGLPIGIALITVGGLGLGVMLSVEAATIKAAITAFETLSRYELGVLPLFVLMAHLCFAAGASRDFFDVAARFVGHRPGGLAISSIAGCAGFGAISGSSLATVATITSVALPEMRKAGYSPAFATGALAAGGTLGALIPPSGALIVFGIIAEVSIGQLFAAAVIPGLTQALFYILAIVLMCRLKPSLGPPSARVGWPERLAFLVNIIDIGLLILFVIGGLFVGWFTPTEAASVGSVGALLLCWRRGRLNRDSFATAMTATLRTTGMIYVVIIGAILFATFITVTGLADWLSGSVTSMDLGPILTIVLIAAVLLVLGSFLDGLALMLLATPIFLPIAMELGMSPIWFGIFLVRTMEIGFVHPPLGLNVYVIQNIAQDIPLQTIFRGIIPFLLTDLLHLGLLIAVPALTLWLPSVVR
ncbi:TRAP transporter large permease [Polymorphobacter sp.]|uniref:TRAP transporter large permease n=1 Tax=Polymorphobacter sp. TaxID=1909290 RepID=UPI003F6EC615